MRVIPIAWTYFDQDAVKEWMQWEVHPGHAAGLAEFAGRSCYESWDKSNPLSRINKNTDTPEKYNANIIKQKHFSVFEHASVTFYIRDVSRSLTHELVRHRHFAYSQRSQRYADESANFIVLPPDVRRSNKAQHILTALDARAKNAYRELMDVMVNELGLPRKRARSAARAALLGSQSTAIVVTGNHRAWREFMSKRKDPAADEEIHLLASSILVELKKLAPSLYADIA